MTKSPVRTLPRSTMVLLDGDGGTCQSTHMETTEALSIAAVLIWAVMLNVLVSFRFAPRRKG